MTTATHSRRYAPVQCGSSGSKAFLLGPPIKRSWKNTVALPWVSGV